MKFSSQYKYQSLPTAGSLVLTQFPSLTLSLRFVSFKLISNSSRFSSVLLFKLLLCPSSSAAILLPPLSHSLFSTLFAQTSPLLANWSSSFGISFSEHPSLVEFLVYFGRLLFLFCFYFFQFFFFVEQTMAVADAPPE